MKYKDVIMIIPALIPVPKFIDPEAPPTEAELALLALYELRETNYQAIEAAINEGIPVSGKYERIISRDAPKLFKDGNEYQFYQMSLKRIVLDDKEQTINAGVDDLVAAGCDIVVGFVYRSDIQQWLADNGYTFPEEVI